MTPYIQALRAITFTTFRKLFVPIAWVVGVLITLLIAATILLAVVHSPWWLLLLAVLIPLAVLLTAVGGFLWAVASRMRPRQFTRDESTQIIGFTDKITRLVETRATPIPIIVFLIAKDVVRGQKSSYLENLINDSTSLKSDFTDIANLFRPQTSTDETLGEGPELSHDK